jgi:Tol biopolymer transport system component
MLRRLGVAASIALTAACSSNSANPFSTPTRAPSADAVLLFVSGSWAEEPGQPRELLALNADGTSVERLTNCAQASPACDFVQLAPSPDRTRLAAIRTTPDAAEGATTLYFMDLARGVEKLLFQNRRIESVDYSPDGSFIVYTAVPTGTQTTDEDLFYSSPDGTGEQALTSTPDFRERSPRVDPFATTAIYEGIDDSTGVGRIYLFSQTQLTTGPEGGEPLPGTPYVVGADADPAWSPDAQSIVFRRLTGVGNGGLGTWDILRQPLDGSSSPSVIATGPLFRGAPDWSAKGIVFVETDAAADRSDLVLLSADGATRTILRTEPAGYRMGAPRWLPGS